METKTADWSKDKSSLRHKGDPCFQKNKTTNESQSYSKNPTQPGFTPGFPQPLCTSAPSFPRSQSRQSPAPAPHASRGSASPASCTGQGVATLDGLLCPRTPAMARSLGSNGHREPLTRKLKLGTGCPSCAAGNFHNLTSGGENPSDSVLCLAQ